MSQKTQRDARPSRLFCSKIVIPLDHILGRGLTGDRSFETVFQLLCRVLVRRDHKSLDPASSLGAKPRNNDLVRMRIIERSLAPSLVCWPAVRFIYTTGDAKAIFRRSTVGSYCVFRDLYNWRAARK